MTESEYNFKGVMTVPSLYDIKYIEVDNSCSGIVPCQHTTTVVLHDGRYGHIRNAVDITSLISLLALKQINPDSTWRGEDVKEHFRQVFGAVFITLRSSNILHVSSQMKSLTQPDAILRKIEFISDDMRNNSTCCSIL